MPKGVPRTGGKRNRGSKKYRSWLLGGRIFSNAEAVFVNQGAAVVTGLRDVPCGHEGQDRRRPGEDSGDGTPARRENGENRKGGSGKGKIARALSSVFMLLESFMQGACDFGKTMLLPLTGFNRKDSPGSAQNKDQSGWQSPSSGDNRQQGKAGTNKQKRDREMNNSGMQGVRNRYHDETLTTHDRHSKAESAKRSVKTPFAFSPSKYLLEDSIT